MDNSEELPVRFSIKDLLYLTVIAGLVLYILMLQWQLAATLRQNKNQILEQTVIYENPANSNSK